MPYSKEYRQEHKDELREKYKETSNRWHRENIKSFAIRCSKVSEQEMIDFIEERKPYANYLKQLVKEDMKKQGRLK